VAALTLEMDEGEVRDAILEWAKRKTGLTANTCSLHVVAGDDSALRAVVTLVPTEGPAKTGATAKPPEPKTGGLKDL
jgi:hypothetical protein